MSEPLRVVQPVTAPTGVPPPPEPRGPVRPFNAFVTGTLWALGVLLPAATLLVELFTGMCAESLFDPLATPVHVLLVASVPAANALALLVLRQEALHRLGLAVALNGAVLAVSALYTLLFLPILPVAIVALVFMGLGLLPLSPLLALVAALVLRSRLVRSAPRGSALPTWWRSALLAGALFVAAELPAATTQVGLHLAATGEPETQHQALRVLRAVGSEEQLRTAAYGGPRRHSILTFALSLREQTGVEEARRIYYRVTGRPFNSRPRPEPRGHAMRGWSWDRDLAAEEVGGRVAGLALRTSTLEGSVEAEAALAYLEWTMELATTAPGQSEARMLLQLPPGGVVSRVTLWVDGEPREAAFAATGKVKAAYESVVRRSQDPLLVTARPGDRVQVQCFPVEQGRPMRIRLGITAPLLLRDGGGSGALVLPSLLERNFELREDFRHAARIESRAALQGPAGASAVARADGVSEWLGSLTDSQLQSPGAVLRAPRAQALSTAWTEEPHGRGAAVIRQHVREEVAERPARLVVVLDGSAGMEPALEELAAALSALPDGMELVVLAALDGVQELVPLQRVDEAGRALAAARVRGLSAAGGQETHAAMARAWTLLPADAPSLVLWVHGPQPLAPEPVGDDAALALAGPRPAEVVDVQVAPGPNAAARALPRTVPLRPLPRLGALREDLTSLIQGWGRPQAVAVRERVPGTAGQEGRRTSAHLARLWARDEVARLLRSRDERQHREAEALAVRFQLVTGASGAVVLEREEQYAQAGLQPVEAGTVPTVPEPETWLLLLVACGVVAAAMLRRRRPA